MKYGPMDPHNFEVVRTVDAIPGYYFAPGGQLMVVATSGGSRLMPLGGSRPYVEVQDTDATTLMRLREAKIEVSFGDPVPYKSEQGWGGGHLVVGDGGQVAIAAYLQPIPQGEFERVYIDVESCAAVRFDGYAKDWMWLPEWEILATRAGVRSILAVSPPPAVTSKSFFAL
jgi:hypothetical protein